MNIKFTKNIIFFSVLILVLNGCTTNTNKKSGKKEFKHNTPLLNEDVKEAILIIDSLETYSILELF